jgi:catechol 2,3-dioxygenase-like lactoylglutathione lyase family enzyme
MHGIWHFSFTVSDLDRSLEFYVGALGLELVHRQIQDNAYTRSLVGHPEAVLEIAQLAVPGEPRGISTHDLELVDYKHPPGERGSRDPWNPGAAHMAFVVEDVEQRYAELRAGGVEFVSPPNRITAGVNEGGATCYFFDPDDIVLEILQPPPHRMRAYLDARDASSA